MNSPYGSPSRIGGNDRSPEDKYKNWKVSDSFKVTKLRVTSREELKKQRANEEDLNKGRSKTSDANSYLKSRRQKARGERRVDILSILDQNLEHIAPTSQEPPHQLQTTSPTRSPSSDSRSKSQYRIAENPTSGNYRNHPGDTEERHTALTTSSPKQQNRLRVLNPFRNRSKDNDADQDRHTQRNESHGTGRRDLLKRTKSDRRTTRRRKEQKEAIESVKQVNKDKEAEMQEILEDVLRKYPKEKCRTFADHKEFAFAELTTQSNHRKDLQITAEKFIDLKSKLQNHLTNALGDDGSIAESSMIHEHPSGQRRPQRSPRNESYQSYGQFWDQHHQQSRDVESNFSKIEKRRTLQATTETSSPRRASQHHLRLHHRDSSPASSPSPSSPTDPTSPRNRVSSPRKQASPRRMQSVVVPPVLSSPRQHINPTSPSKTKMDDPTSPKERHTSVDVSKSSKSLSLPKPRAPSLDDHLPTKGTSFEKEDSTSITELDDESTLVPVVKLLIVDPSGNVGKYSGTICVNTGKPHGCGRLEYEGSGSYQGDWNQGSWSGYGRHIKPNGDIYEGHFFENSKHGMGTYGYRDGKRVFEGRYVMGQRVDGQMTYGDGSVYKGQWYDGKRHGRGTYRFKDSSIYKGEFLQDVIHGVGQLVWPDGAKYVGEWNQGHRHGMGKEFTSDGRLRYEGKWKDSVPVP
jgi:hypothetical protein